MTVPVADEVTVESRRSVKETAAMEGCCEKLYQLPTYSLSPHFSFRDCQVLRDAWVFDLKVIVARCLSMAKVLRLIEVSL